MYIFEMSCLSVASSAIIFSDSEGCLFTLLRVSFVVQKLLSLVNYVPFGRRQWHPTPVLLPGKSHGQRSLVGCSPWGHTESDMTEAT